MESQVRLVTATQLRARCSALLAEVFEHRVEIIVTKRGKPVAKLVPLKRPPIPDLRHMVTSMGDIVSPIDEEWEVLSDNPEWPWWEKDA